MDKDESVRRSAVDKILSALDMQYTLKKKSFKEQISAHIDNAENDYKDAGSGNERFSIIVDKRIRARLKGISNEKISNACEDYVTRLGAKVKFVSISRRPRAAWNGKIFFSISAK